MKLSKNYKIVAAFIVLVILSLGAWGLYELLKPKDVGSGIGSGKGWECNTKKGQCEKTGHNGAYGVFDKKDDCEKAGCHSTVFNG